MQKYYGHWPSFSKLFVYYKICQVNTIVIVFISEIICAKVLL